MTHCPAAGHGTAPDGVVLDTNVVLDWLVFDNPAVRDLFGALECGQLRWHSCPRMRAEIRHMLGHASLAAWGHDPEAALARLDRWPVEYPDPAPGRACVPRCRDEDDQIFVDLALLTGTRWLITRDRDLLTLRRRLMPHGLEPVTPEAWSRQRDDFRLVAPDGAA